MPVNGLLSNFLVYISWEVWIVPKKYLPNGVAGSANKWITTTPDQPDTYQNETR